MAELTGERLDPTKVVAQHHARLELGANIDDLDLLRFCSADRHGRLERRLQRAPSGERPPAVEDPRDESLLERILQMGAADERGSVQGLRDQLERGLAVAVLQVVPAQPEAVRTQQQLASGASDDGYLLGRVAGADRRRGSRPPPPGRSSLVLVSGRHTRVSSNRRCTPPSQLARARAAAARELSATVALA